MKTKFNLLVLYVLLPLFLTSCKDSEVKTPAEKRIEKNHPKEAESQDTPINDTLSVESDSIDSNMRNQSDTHGRDTDAGN